MLSRARNTALWLGALLVGLYVRHLYVLWKYTLDVPLADEWDQWPSWKPALSWSWLFRQHCEHVIVPTKLQTWVIWRLAAGNMVFHVIFNFLLFGAVLGSFVYLLSRTRPKISPAVILAFCAFLTSMLPYENYVTGFQTAFHFPLLFFILSTLCLFSESQSWGAVLAGAAFAIAGAFSLASGLATALVSLAIFALFKINRARLLPKGSRQRELLQLFAVAAAIALALAFWSRLYEPVDVHPVHILPNRFLFWDFIFNLVSLGFGFSDVSGRIGLFCTILVVLPAVPLVVRGFRDSCASNWRLVALYAGLLGALAAIAFGRAGFAIAAAKTPRYATIAMLLVPLCAIAWYLFLSAYPRTRNGILAGLFLFCLMGSSAHWSTAPYRRELHRREVGLECLRKAYEAGGPATCPTVYPWTLDQQLKEARQARLSFFRKIEANLAPEKPRS